MRVIITVVFATLKEILYSLVFLLLFLYIYTLLGMELFSGTPEGPYRPSFESFPLAFTSAFQVLTGSQWPEVFMAISSSPAPEAPYLAAIYCISWIFIGNYYLLNIFLAILLDSFAEN